MIFPKWAWRKINLILFFFVGVILSATQISQAGDPIPVKTEFIGAGFGANTPVMKQLVETFLAENQGEPIQFQPGLGTSSGVKALIAGKIDFALASRALRGEELKSKLTEISYAKTSLVFVVNSSVQETNLEAKDVIEIYNGKKAKWADGSAILVLMREEGDSGAELLMAKIPELKNIFRKAWRSSSWRVEYSDRAALESVGRLSKSIVWSDYSESVVNQSQKKILTYSNFMPTEKAVSDGSYPLVRDLTLVYKDPPPARLRSFFDFIKSKKGADILRKYNAVPVQ